MQALSSEWIRTSVEVGALILTVGTTVGSVLFFAGRMSNSVEVLKDIIAEHDKAIKDHNLSIIDLKLDVRELQAVIDVPVHKPNGKGRLHN